MIECTTISGMDSAEGERPVAASDEDEGIVVCEQYGFASLPPGTASAVVVAPGGDGENRVALAVSAPDGRPAMAAGDAIQWTISGHKVMLENDGGVTIAGKDGGQITIAAGTGKITLTAGTLADVEINVDNGASALIGDNAALALLKAQATQDFFAQAIAYVLLPGNFIPNDGGVKAFQSLLAFITGTLPAPPPGLAVSAGTTKAKGT